MKSKDAVGIGGRADRRAGPGGSARPTHAKANKRAATGRRTANQLLGAKAEQAAADFLQAQGLQILERNYLRRLGELDIVARDGETLVIAEVRCRSSNRFGGAAASVDTRKRMRLIRAASQLLQQRRDLARLRVRFDVLAVDAVGCETTQVEWIQHAFST